MFPLPRIQQRQVHCAVAVTLPGKYLSMNRDFCVGVGSCPCNCSSTHAEATTESVFATSVRKELAFAGWASAPTTMSSHLYGGCYPPLQPLRFVWPPWVVFSATLQPLTHINAGHPVQIQVSASCEHDRFSKQRSMRLAGIFAPIPTTWFSVSTCWRAFAATDSLCLKRREVLGNRKPSWCRYLQDPHARQHKRMLQFHASLQRRQLQSLYCVLHSDQHTCMVCGLRLLMMLLLVVGCWLVLRWLQLQLQLLDDAAC